MSVVNYLRAKLFIFCTLPFSKQRGPSHFCHGSAFIGALQSPCSKNGQESNNDQLFGDDLLGYKLDRIRNFKAGHFAWNLRPVYY